MGSLTNTLLPPRSILAMFYSFFCSPIGKTAVMATPHPFLGKSFLPHCSWPGSLHPTRFSHPFIHSCTSECARPQCTGRRTPASGIQWVTAFRSTLSARRNPPPGNTVSSPGIMQGLECYSQSEVKGVMEALSSFHFQERKAPASLSCELLREG